MELRQPSPGLAPAIFRHRFPEQMERASRNVLMIRCCNRRGHVAQLAEQGTLNPQVVGSIPTVLTISNPQQAAILVWGPGQGEKNAPGVYDWGLLGAKRKIPGWFLGIWDSAGAERK